jgi:hypothetical protein
MQIRKRITGSTLCLSITAFKKKLYKPPRPSKPGCYSQANPNNLLQKERKKSERASVADPGCLSRIPDPDFYPSQIPDPQQQQKRRGKN